MIHFLHRLFHYHCDECAHACQSCETLREQLSIANADRQQLLKAILDANKPPAIAQTVAPPGLPEPIIPKVMPWRMRREMLEQEDRKKAELMKEKEKELKEASKSTEELENELGIEHASN